MGILQFESVNCKDCCKCIGVCPVKAIEVKNHRAMIVERDCILCGNCTIACPQHTKHGTDESTSVKELIRSGRKVIASVAPSYAAYFDGCGFEALRTALKALGFYDARETAEGAYIVKSEYEKLIANGIKKPVISSCCTTLNLYIQKHYPDAIELLAPVITPMQAHARVIHRDEPGAAVVFIGPCISKKAECEQEESELEYAITFDELDDWLGEAKITIMPAAESEQRLSRFFPVSGGILKTMTQQGGVNYVAVDGPEGCMAAVKDAMAGKLDGCFIEMSFCQGSCIGGPVFRNVNRSAAASYVKVAHDAAGEAQPDARVQVHQPGLAIRDDGVAEQSARHGHGQSPNAMRRRADVADGDPADRPRLLQDGGARRQHALAKAADLEAARLGRRVRDVQRALRQP